VEKETGRCSRIISSLLTFSRKSPPSFGKVDVAQVLDRSVLLSRHKLDLSDIRLTADVNGDLPPVEGDPNSLQQCVINLIFNAIDAMPGGGDLTLTGRHDPEAGRVEIRVADTGVGIPEAERDHIFEPFHTTKKEGHGVGLGLSTVYGIVQRHGGDVRVESREGEGAAFTLSLPVRSAPDSEGNP
jgi:signal transduction histidine kinase